MSLEVPWQVEAEWPPSWKSAHGELRRTAWRLDGLAMGSLRFAAESETGVVQVWADPAVAHDFLLGPDPLIALDEARLGGALDSARALLHPAQTLERLALEPVAERRTARGLLRSLIGKLRRNAEPPFAMQARADAYRFLVDPRHGTVVQATGIADGSIIERVELVGVHFVTREAA